MEAKGFQAFAKGEIGEKALAGVWAGCHPA